MHKPSRTVLVERLDPRRLMSSTGGVNFAGQYEVVKSGILYDVNLTAGSSGAYTGTVWANGAAVSLGGTESDSGVLSGQINTSLGEVAFTAALSGKTLTVTYPASGGKVGLLQTSTTPAPAQPALESGSGSLLSYLKPANWTVTESASGLMLRSHDKTEQVGVLGTVTEGTSTLASIASAEESAGVKLIYGKVLAKKSTSTEAFQSGVALVTFDYKGTTYAAAEAVETYTDTNKGTYDAKTKTYSGVTLTEIYEASAPKAEFINDNSFLLYMLTSIKANSTLTTGSAPAGAKKVALSNPGLVVPGITPSTTKKGKTKSTPADGLYNSLYKNSYYDTAEGELLQYEALEQTEAVDSSVNEFCNELLS